MKLINKMSHQKIKKLYYSYKINIYIIKCTHCNYSCNQTCLILLVTCILVACDNYVTTKVNVTPN
jgi:hypothetical protein